MLAFIFHQTWIPTNSILGLPAGHGIEHVVGRIFNFNILISFLGSDDLTWCFVGNGNNTMRARGELCPKVPKFDEFHIQIR